ATSLSFFILATLAMPAAGQTTRPAPVSDDAEAGSGDEDDEEPSAGESTAEPPADRPRNFWTRELALSDWGGARTELKDAGIRLELLYASQYMQNFRGGLQTNNGHRFSGGYDLNIKT